MYLSHKFMFSILIECSIPRRAYRSHYWTCSHFILLSLYKKKFYFISFVRIILNLKINLFILSIIFKIKVILPLSNIKLALLKAQSVLSKRLRLNYKVNY